MTIRIGSRDSRLAIEQARIAADLLRRAHPGIQTEIVTMRTAGDMLTDKPLDETGGKGFFTGEIDAALLENRVDLAVHSLKDMPACLPAGLVIAAYCAAEDPRDALILPGGAAEPDMTKPAGCSAKRRSIQLGSLYPGIRCAPVRGNVPTRLAKLDAGEYGSLVLALAGLKRLGLEKRASRIFNNDEMLPAAGQGVLAVVGREASGAAHLAGEIDDPSTRRRALAERTFTRMLNGGCGLPVAAFCRESDGRLELAGAYCPEGAAAMIKCTLRGDPANPAELGRRLAFRLLAESARSRNRLGRVSLIGAGPGGAGLLTARAEAALADADVVVFDRLAGPGVLAKIPQKAEKIYAGKESGLHTMPQEDINAILVQKAAAGLRVARLKGGDPFFFGRGGEEALCLADAAIPWEAIPGVPSALAASGLAGIPLTHRGIASQIHIISARNARGADIDFSALARQCAAGATLVFMMGLSRLERICRSLVDAGLPGGTPAAVVSRGTTAKEQKVLATAASLAACAAKAGIKPPGIIVIGGVCRLAQTLAVCEQKPLAGLRVAVTRPVQEPRPPDGFCGNPLAKMLDERGAEVIAIPAIKIVPIAAPPLLREILKSLPPPGAAPAKTWFAFTSVHGVEAFFAKLAEYRVDIRALAACKFAALGNAARSALARRGIITDLAPGVFSGRALGEALAKNTGPDETVIFPRSAIGGAALIDALKTANIRCIDVPVYDTVPETGYENPDFRRRLTEGLDYAAFTSPSAVDAFARIFGNTGAAALCIGEMTAEPARALGMQTIVPAAASLEGMVEALVETVE